MVRWDRGTRIAAVMGLAGIVIEAIAIVLISTDRVATSIGRPLVIAGMLIAFVPLFALSRRSRR